MRMLDTNQTWHAQRCDSSSGLPYIVGPWFKDCDLSTSCSGPVKTLGAAQVKAAATVIVSTNDEDGVAEAIERFVL